MLITTFRDSVIHRIPFHRLETSALDHFDDLLFSHFYFAAGLDGVTMGELAAVGNGARREREREIDITVPRIRIPSDEPV
jgi:hypothetical protein